MINIHIDRSQYAYKFTWILAPYHNFSPLFTSLFETATWKYHNLIPYVTQRLNYLFTMSLNYQFQHVTVSSMFTHNYFTYSLLFTFHSHNGSTFHSQYVYGMSSFFFSESPLWKYLNPACLRNVFMVTIIMKFHS